MEEGDLLAVAFANTYRAVRGVPRDDLATSVLVRDWLTRHAEAVDALDEADVARFVALRDAIRSLAAAAADGQPFEPSVVTLVNDAAAAAPRWPRLDVRGSDAAPVERGAAELAVAVEQTAADPVTAALARVAGSAITLFGGPLVTHVRACGNPSCVQFFVTRQHRREWCSPACGNRARVLRHARRHAVTP